MHVCSRPPSLLVHRRFPPQFIVHARPRPLSSARSPALPSAVHRPPVNLNQSAHALDRPLPHSIVKACPRPRSRLPTAIRARPPPHCRARLPAIALPPPLAHPPSCSPALRTPTLARIRTRSPPCSFAHPPTLSLTHLHSPSRTPITTVIPRRLPPRSPAYHYRPLRPRRPVFRRCVSIAPFFLSRLRRQRVHSFDIYQLLMNPEVI